MAQSTGNDLKASDFLLCWDLSSVASLPEIQAGGRDCWRSLANADWVWADGYIANRPELITQLNLPGSPGNGEIVYSLYHRFGDNAAGYLAGTLSWALWDSRRRALVVVGDRIGNHSFYLTTLNQRLWLANRLEVLLGIPALPRQLNPRSIVAQITGWVPLEGETFYEYIHKLEPGGWLQLQAEGRRGGRYWQVEPQPVLKLPSDEEYGQALRELLFGIIAGHTPAGQAGITLSSGLDSTSVAAAIRQITPATRLTAFCLAAPEVPEADESSISAEVSRFLDIPYVPIRADRHWPMSSAEGVQTFASTPFLVPFSEQIGEMLAAARQQDLQVVFTGISGDHLFGGNIFAYPDLLLTGRWIELSRQIRYHLPRSSMGYSLSQIVRRMILSPIRTAYFPGWKMDTTSPAPWLRPSYVDLYREHFIRPPKVRWMLPGRLARLRMLGQPTLSNAVEAMNRQAESFGVEFRHPLLDHRLIEFAASLPTGQTFRASQRKIIVRNAMRGHLPASVLEMWNKIEPSAIFHLGLREREQAKVWRLMTNMRCAELGYVDEFALRQAYQDYLDQKTDNTLFWYTLTLEDWLRRWL
jgi:asparagine synthase (glutamine-hydrolysing)